VDQIKKEKIIKGSNKSENHFIRACGPCLGRGMRGECAVSSDEGPRARHASRALRRACGQGAVLSLCMVRLGSGRFGVGFWVGFWVGLRARDFPTGECSPGPP